VQRDHKEHGAEEVLFSEIDELDVVLLETDEDDVEDEVEVEQLERSLRPVFCDGPQEPQDRELKDDRDRESDRSCDQGHIFRTEVKEVIADFNLVDHHQSDEQEEDPSLVFLELREDVVLLRVLAPERGQVLRCFYQVNRIFSRCFIVLDLTVQDGFFIAVHAFDRVREGQLVF
jgi:hypothetical protein